MQFRRWFAAGLVVAASLALSGGGGKSKAYMLTVHVESSAEEAPKFAGPVKLGSESRQYYFKKIPDFTDDHVEWFYPFVSEDGKSFGAAFKLKPHKAQALKALSLSHQGKLLGIRIPSAPYAALLIDRPIDDGVIVYWKGLAKEHLKAFEKNFPHVDEFQPSGAPVPGADFVPPTAAR